VSRVRGRLPVDVLEPVIAKQSADAQPFFWLALSSENYDLMQLSDVADRVVKARLQSLRASAAPASSGSGATRCGLGAAGGAIGARADRAGRRGAIASRNVEIPAGRIESTRREFSVRSLGRAQDAAGVRRNGGTQSGHPARQAQGHRHVELGPEDDRSIFRYNGSPSVAIGVVRQSKANLLDVARNIRQAIPDIQRALPLGVKLQSAYDGSVFVTHSIDDARLTLLIAAILVVLIIFVFLRNVRATIIPGLAIRRRSSRRSRLCISWAFRSTTSRCSPHDRHRHRGGRRDHRARERLPAPRGAARSPGAGGGERHQRDRLRRDRDHDRAGGGVFAARVPDGHAGRLLSEFGIAVAGAVVISGFVALTLTPMLCAKILRMQHQHGKAFQLFERGFNAMSERYAQLLRRAVDHRIAVLLGTLAVVAVSVAAFLFYPRTRLQRELIPTDDRGFFLVAVRALKARRCRTPTATCARLSRSLAEPLTSTVFHDRRGVRRGVNSAFIGVIMKDWSERHTTVDQTIGGMFPQLMGISGVLAYPFAPGAIGFNPPIQYVVQNPDFAKLTDMMGPFVRRVSQIKVS